MLKGTNIRYARAYNFRIVLETIRLHGPISRADIARRSGLTAQTISNITRDGLESGLILEGDQVREGRGAPSMGLKLNHAGAYSIGLDIDKDHITGVLVDLGGYVRQRLHEEIHFPTPEVAFERIERMAARLMALERLERSSVWGIGIGFPGPLAIERDRNVSSVINIMNFPGWQNVPVTEEMQRRLGLPVLVENNATAAAVGERWYGDGQHIKTFFYVFFTVGLGGGLIVNGQPFEGFSGNAGEIGFIPLPEDDRTDEGLGRGYIGRYFDLTRLYRLLAAEGHAAKAPADLGPLYEQRAPALMEWIQAAADYLTPVLLSIECIIDPEAVFFGGRLPDPILLDIIQRIREALPARRIMPHRGALQLRLGTAGADAAALGVATLPMYAFFAPEPQMLMKRTAAERHPTSMLMPDRA